MSKKFDQLLSPIQRRFLYLPYEHSEKLPDQEKSVALFAAMKEHDPMGYDYAVRHYEVIERYGRFPHRNAALGRENTPEEEEYLAQEGAGFNIANLQISNRPVKNLCFPHSFGGRS